MNISIYLPDSLKNSFDSYVKNNGMTRNAAVRKAIELLLKNDEKRQWGDWMNDLDSDPDFPTKEGIRMDLKPPQEDFF